jgi:hypothetical protein
MPVILLAVIKFSLSVCTSSVVVTLLSFHLTFFECSTRKHMTQLYSVVE